jgi:hypothetical protein
VAFGVIFFKPPLEDMSPHLEREELAREMLIELVDEGEVPE